MIEADRWALSAQESLDRFYGRDRFGLPHNTSPRTRSLRPVLNYWWVANLIQARLDGAAHPEGHRWVADAERLFAALVRRNRGLTNDYFDDMLWLGNSAVSLYEQTGKTEYLDAARTLWTEAHQFGVNPSQGGGVAWRRSQLDYKNAPTALLFILLALRLDTVTSPGWRTEAAGAVQSWFDQTLAQVVPEPQFASEPRLRLADGVNRVGDGAVDREWQFSYNYGLYIAAQLAWWRQDSGDGFLSRARTAALSAVALFREGDDFFPSEHTPGDAGLFRGILFRHLADLDQVLGDQDPARIAMQSFVTDATDSLWRCYGTDDGILAGDDWRTRQKAPFSYSSQVSAIMAFEALSRMTSGHE